MAVAMPSTATRPAAIVVLDGMSVLFHSARRLVRMRVGGRHRLIESVSTGYVHLITKGQRIANQEVSLLTQKRPRSRARIASLGMEEHH
jgi:hypothetical protein